MWYTMTDGALTDTAQVDFTLNDNPPVANDDSYAFLHDTNHFVGVGAGGLLDNDTDADGEARHVTGAMDTAGTYIPLDTWVTLPSGARFYVCADRKSDV